MTNEAMFRDEEKRRRFVELYGESPFLRLNLLDVPEDRWPAVMAAFEEARRLAGK